MYLPNHFDEGRDEELLGTIAAYPLGALVVNGPNGLDANHVPFLIDEKQPGVVGVPADHDAPKITGRPALSMSNEQFASLAGPPKNVEATRFVPVGFNAVMNPSSQMSVPLQAG